MTVPQQCWRRRIDREVHQQTLSLDLSLDLNLKTSKSNINGTIMQKNYLFAQYIDDTMFMPKRVIFQYETYY